MGRRSIAAGRFLPADLGDRDFALRFVGFVAFFLLMLALLGYQKAACHLGVGPARAAAAVLVLVVLGLLWAALRSKEEVSMDHEELLEPEDVVRQLASFELSVHDLIDEGGWKSLSDSLRFAEAAGAQSDLLASRARRRLAVKVGVGIIVALAVVFALANFAEWFWWLAKDDC